MTTKPVWSRRAPSARLSIFRHGSRKISRAAAGGRDARRGCTGRLGLGPPDRAAEFSKGQRAPSRLQRARVPREGAGAATDAGRARRPGDHRRRPGAPVPHRPLLEPLGRAVPATCASTTGKPTATASCSPSCSRRNGATLSGHVWATKAGPAKRPGIVITNGSVQATEELYWTRPRCWPRAGYVVLTWDPQGQGRSDTQGAAPDEQEGTPSQSDGRSFFDGTVDALNFFFAAGQARTPRSSPVRAGPATRPSRSGGSRPGSTPALTRSGGCSTRAASASPATPTARAASPTWARRTRAKAIVGWDNLRTPSTDQEQPCPADPTQRAAAAITKPALGISNDYGITRSRSRRTRPARQGRRLARVQQGRRRQRRDRHPRRDAHRVVVHPQSAFGATLRGADLIAWYTTAWFDKYVKGDPTADARVLTARGATTRTRPRWIRSATGTCPASISARGSTSG